MPEAVNDRRTADTSDEIVDSITREIAKDSEREDNSDIEKTECGGK